MEDVLNTVRNRRTLWFSWGLAFLYFVVEFVGGVLTNSLALLTDAVYELVGVGELGLALFAAGTTPPAKTFGRKRGKMLAIIVNMALLVFVTFWLYEVYRRLQEPEAVATMPMLIVATLGLVPNLIGVWFLRAGANKCPSIGGALEVIRGMLGGVGVIVAGVIMLLTGWWYADTLLSVLIGLYILPRAWMLMNVVMEDVPRHIDLTTLEGAMLGVEGVASVHDLHAWNVTPGFDALSAHVVLNETVEPEVNAVEENLATLLKERFGIDHATIHIESSGRDDGARESGAMRHGRKPP